MWVDLIFPLAHTGSTKLTQYALCPVAESVEHGFRMREIMCSNSWSSQVNDLLNWSLLLPSQVLGIISGARIGSLSVRIIWLCGIADLDACSLVSKVRQHYKVAINPGRLSVRIMWLSGIWGHGVDSLVSEWGSTIKSSWLHPVTNKYLSWYDLRCC